MTTLARWLTANWWRVLIVCGAGIAAYASVESQLAVVREQHTTIIHLLCVEHPRDSLCPLHP